MFGFLNAIYRDFKNGCPPEVMAQWRAYCLSTKFHFRVIDNDDDAHLAMLQYRQDVKADKVGMAHTLLQTIHDVVAFRTRKPRMSVESLAGEYAKVKFIEEDVLDTPTSVEFIKRALFIHDKMLPVKAIRDLLVQAQEGEKKNPFDKITKLKVICHATEDEGQLQFCLELLLARHLIPLRIVAGGLGWRGISAQIVASRFPQQEIYKPCEIV